MILLKNIWAFIAAVGSKRVSHNNLQQGTGVSVWWRGETPRPAVSGITEASRYSPSQALMKGIAWLVAYCAVKWYGYQWMYAFQNALTAPKHRWCVTSQKWYLPSIIVTGSSILGRNIFGPNTVARFWTLILLMLEWAWTSSRNLEKPPPGKSKERSKSVNSQTVVILRQEPFCPIFIQFWYLKCF